MLATPLLLSLALAPGTRAEAWRAARPEAPLPDVLHLPADPLIIPILP